MRLSRKFYYSGKFYNNNNDNNDNNLKIFHTIYLCRIVKIVR